MSDTAVSTPTKDPLPASVMLAAGAALVLWSGTAIANRIAVAYMDGLTAGVLRSMLAGFIALAVAAAWRMPFPRRNLERLLLAVSGLTSFAAWPALLSVGVANTTAGNAALLMAMTPVFTVLVGAAANAEPENGRRWPRGRWWAGAAAAFAGAAALTAARGLTPDLLSPQAGAAGNLIILGGTAVCALGYVTGARLSPVIGAGATTLWGLAIALLGLIPTFLWIAPATDWLAVPARGWLAVGWMTLLSSLAGYALWFFALGRGGIERVGSLQLGLPVLTLAGAALVLGETLTPLLLTSCVVVVCGTWIAHAARA